MIAHRRMPGPLTRLCRRDSTGWKAGSAGRRGMTVLELLVVMTVILLLVVLIVPAVQRVRESARRVQCVNHLRQIGLALHQFHEQQSRLPAGWTTHEPSPVAWSWTSQLLPHLEQPSLAAAIAGTSSPSETLELLSRHSLPVMLCPSDITPSSFVLYRETEHGDAVAAPSTSQAGVPLVTLPTGNYVGMFGDLDPDVTDGHLGDGTFLQDRSVRWQELVQGMSHVMIVSERTARKLPSTWLGVHVSGEDAPARMTGFAWLGPNRSDADECELDSRHDGLINALFADGHVQSVSDGIDTSVYRLMSRRHE